MAARSTRSPISPPARSQRLTCRFRPDRIGGGGRRAGHRRRTVNGAKLSATSNPVAISVHAPRADHQPSSPDRPTGRAGRADRPSRSTVHNTGDVPLDVRVSNDPATRLRLHRERTSPLTAARCGQEVHRGGRRGGQHAHRHRHFQRDPGGSPVGRPKPIAGQRPPVSASRHQQPRPVSGSGSSGSGGTPLPGGGSGGGRERRHPAAAATRAGDDTEASWPGPGST